MSHSGRRGLDLLSPADGNNHHRKYKWDADSILQGASQLRVVGKSRRDRRLIVFRSQLTEDRIVKTVECLRVSKKRSVHSLIASNSSVG